MTRNYAKDYLSEIADGDEDFLEILAQTFLEEIPLDLDALQEAISNDNRKLAYQFAHKMKPNIEMFGIDLLKEITNIENWSKTSKARESIKVSLDHVISILNTVFQELREDYQL